MQVVPPSNKETAAVFIQHVLRRLCFHLVCSMEMLELLSATFIFAIDIYQASIKKKISESHSMQTVDINEFSYGSVKTLPW